MHKRVGIVLAVVVVALIGIVVWYVPSPQEREPVYQGKGLRTWLRVARGESHWEMRSRAESAIRQIGTNAIPTLLEMLRQKDSPLTSKLTLWWGRHIAEMHHLPSSIQFPHWYRNNAQFLNADAERGFEILGPNAQETVSALMEVYEQNISPSSQMYAQGALTAVAVAAPSTIPSFLRWAASTNLSVRLIAVMVLAQSQHEPSLVVPALAKCLSDTNNQIRTFAAQGLGWYGAEARLAVPALVPLLGDSYVPARVTAAIALKKIDPEAAAKAGVK